MEKNSGYNPTVETSIDQEWYQRFETITSQTEVFEQFDGDGEKREAQKALFYSGEIENPTLDYPKLDLDKLTTEEEQLLRLKQDILTQEKQPVVAQVYRWKLNERIAEIRMLQAAARGDMHRFSRYSEFVYGKPSGEVFDYSLSAIRTKIAKAKDSGDEQQIKVANELVALLPGEVEKTDIKKPDEATIDGAHQIVQTQYNEMNLQLPERGEVLSAEIIDAFEQSLSHIGADKWQVIPDTSSRPKINTNQAEKKITVPESRTVDSMKLKKLIMHEIRTHVERREKGERSKLSLLGLGLDRYMKAEEGIATFNEQAFEGKVRAYSGIDMHLAASLAKGLDGKPRNFREVFEILYRNFLLRDLPKYEDKTEAIAKSRESAWNNTVRVFRGTDCKTQGAIFTKDIAYREGNIAIWDLVSRDQNEILKFSIGKYDPTNERHIWILSQLGILDSDLEELEK